MLKHGFNQLLHLSVKTALIIENYSLQTTFDLLNRFFKIAHPQNAMQFCLAAICLNATFFSCIHRQGHCTD